MKKIIYAILAIILLLLLFSGIYYFYLVKPEIKRMESQLKENTLQLNILDNNPTKIFNDTYTDTEFQKDLNLYGKTLGIMDETDEKYKKRRISDDMDKFTQIIFINKRNSLIGYDGFIKSLETKESQQEDVLIYLKNRDAIFKSSDTILTMLKFGLGKNAPLEYKISKSLIALFNEKYGNNSIIEGFINNDDKNFYEKRFPVLVNIKSAYEEKNYDLLKIYFKQIREYTGYLSGFDSDLRYEYSYKNGKNLTVEKVFTKKVADYIFLYKQADKFREIKDEEDRMSHMVLNYELAN